MARGNKAQLQQLAVVKRKAFEKLRGKQCGLRHRLSIRRCCRRIRVQGDCCHCGICLWAVKPRSGSERKRKQQLAVVKRRASIKASWEAVVSDISIDMERRVICSCYSKLKVRNNLKEEIL